VGQARALAIGIAALVLTASAPVVWAALLGSAAEARAAQRQVREVPQVKCSKGQYRFDPRDYRCLEVTVYEIRNGRRVPRHYHVWERRHKAR
jgi:hypothetical protein